MPRAVNSRHDDLSLRKAFLSLSSPMVTAMTGSAGCGRWRWRRGALLLIAIAALPVLLFLVPGPPPTTGSAGSRLARGSDERCAFQLAENAITRQTRFAEARNWNIDWGDNGIANSDEDPPRGYQDLVDVDASRQWQNNTGQAFPPIEWQVPGGAPGQAAATWAQYEAGRVSVLHDFLNGRALAAGAGAGRPAHRAVLAWDGREPGLDQGLDVSYLGIVTAEGEVLSGRGRPVRAVVRRAVRVLPRAFDHWLVYAREVTRNGAPVDAGRIRANKLDGEEHMPRLVRLELPGAPSPYFDWNSGDGWPRLPAVARPTRWRTPVFSGTFNGNLFFDEAAGADTVVIRGEPGGTRVNGSVLVSGVNLLVDTGPGEVTISTRYNATGSFAGLEEPRVFPALLVDGGNVTVRGENRLRVEGLAYCSTADGVFSACEGTAVTIEGMVVAGVASLSEATTITWDRRLYENPPPFFLAAGAGEVYLAAADGNLNDFFLDVDYTRRR